MSFNTWDSPAAQRIILPNALLRNIVPDSSKQYWPVMWQREMS